LKMLQSLSCHSQIISLLDHYEEVTVYKDRYMNLVMQYVPETLLSRCEYYGQSGDAIPNDLIQIYSFQLCKAVNYCHIKQIAHCDIKPTNLLIDTATNRLLLCDLGCSMKMETRYHDSIEFKLNEDEEDEIECKDDGEYPSYIGSRYYRAPEIILHSKSYDCKVDVWSIGCVIAEMFLGTFLFEGQRNESEHLDDIIRKLGTPTMDDIDAMNAEYEHKQKLLDKKEEGESWDMLFCGVMEMPESAISMISKMLTYSPKKRSTALQTLGESYFADLETNDAVKELLFDWTDLEIRYAKAHGVALSLNE